MKDEKQKPIATGNNWNPFSARPGLDFAALVTTLVAVGSFELAVGFLLQAPLHAARLLLDFKQLAFLYAIWAFASLFGFFFVTNSFMKRWATILKMPTCPLWMKTVARFFLISPLLSVWFTIYTLMFAKDGAIFQDGDRRHVILVTALATLFLFHFGFLGWELSQGQVHFARSEFHLVNEVSVRDSLRTSLPGAREEMWLPGEVFQVHLYPYLSPLMKLTLAVYEDFTRTKTLADEISKAPNVFCAESSLYIGQAVPNCFLTQYRKLAAQRAFVTPAFGVLYESMYRQKAMAAHAKPDSAMESFALNTASVDNIVTLLEPGPLLYDRQQLLHPIGLLSVYGSPELPAVTIGQDLQRQVLSSKFLPMLAPELIKLGKGLDDMKSALSPADDTLAHETLSSLAQRLKALELDPLALHPVLH